MCRTKKPPGNERRGGGANRSDYQLDSTEPDHSASLADGRCDKPHPAAFADRCGSDLSIQGKAAPVLDCIGTKALHRHSGFLAVQGCCVVTGHSCKARQSENVIDAAAPRQGIVGKIALPTTGMMRPKRSDFARLKSIYGSAAEDPAQLKSAGFLVKRPAMVNREGLGWMEHRARASLQCCWLGRSATTDYPVALPCNKLHCGTCACDWSSCTH